MQVHHASRSLHGGRDQMDCESAIHDFKSGVCVLLIATSVAARGLDVKDLLVVINYDPPNHHEDYIHRVGLVGRTSEAGFTCLSYETCTAQKLTQALLSSLAHSPSPSLHQSPYASSIPPRPHFQESMANSVVRIAFGNSFLHGQR